MTPTTIADIDWTVWRARDDATLVFVVTDERILLIRKKRGLGAGKINGPGGRVHAGETPVECATREVREELLVEVEDLRHHGELRFQFKDGYSIHVHVFRTSNLTGVPSETPEAFPLWFAFDEIPYDEMWADDRIWLPHVLQERHVEGWFLFDGDDMLDHRLEVFPLSATPEMRTGGVGG